jgi:hypothetical protein
VVTDDLILTARNRSVTTVPEGEDSLLLPYRLFVIGRTSKPS